MKLYEFQAKEVLRKFDIKTPKGVMVESLEEIDEKIKDLDSHLYVVKAQVHTGGRGKAGGVKVTKNKGEIKELASKILGMKIKEHTVKKLYIEEGVNIENEIYISFLFNREEGRHGFICSNEGGMEIEEVAKKWPEKVLKMSVDPVAGFKPFHGREILSYLPYEMPVLKKLYAFANSLYRAYMESDAELLEINPLVITKEGDVIACDAKMVVNDNAVFRHKDIAAYMDRAAMDPLELEAKDADLSYVRLDGNIGCLVNGAGLAMATMDVIKNFGGDPANFLDIGGGAKADLVEKALGIIVQDKNVKAILINIFGGIVRTDEVAKGLFAAKEKFGIDLPVVIRLVGTNEEEARKMLSDHGFTAVSEMNEAIKEVIKIAG